MAGNVFTWSSPVDQLTAIDVALVLLVVPCSSSMLSLTRNALLQA
jgi:hypothetical protein